MESLHVLITVYMSDVYRLYKHKSFKRPPATYREGLITLHETIYDHYGIMVPLVELVRWCHEGISIPYKQVVSLDDVTLMELVGFTHTLPVSDVLRKTMVTAYLHRLINDRDIIHTLTYETLTTQQCRYYNRLELQVTGTRYDSVYVEYFKRVFYQ
jgi:hypothetical protein